MSDYQESKDDTVCDKCGGELYQRDDDKPEAIKERLATYQRETAPILDYYDRAGVLKRVDGSLPVDQVVSQLLAKLS